MAGTVQASGFGSGLFFSHRAPVRDSVSVMPNGVLSLEDSRRTRTPCPDDIRLGAQSSDRNGINVRTNKEMDRGTRSGAEIPMCKGGDTGGSGGSGG